MIFDFNTHMGKVQNKPIKKNLRSGHCDGLNEAIGTLDGVSVALLPVQLPANVPGRQKVPATHMRDSSAVPASWLWLGTDPVIQASME